MSIVITWAERDISISSDPRLRVERGPLFSFVNGSCREELFLIEAFALWSQIGRLGFKWGSWIKTLTNGEASNYHSKIKLGSLRSQKWLELWLIQFRWQNRCSGWESSELTTIALFLSSVSHMLLCLSPWKKAWQQVTQVLIVHLSLLLLLLLSVLVMILL